MCDLVDKKANRLIVAIAAAFLLASCQPSLSMWVIPGSTADHLVLGFSTDRDGEIKVQPAEIRVFPCDSISRQSDGSDYPSEERAVWSAWAPPDALPAPTNRILYGQGLTNRRPAKPLTAPGCYVVLAYASLSSATVGFKIAPDGKVIEMTRAEYEDVFK